MRKLFSFIAAVLFAGSMMANPYTLTFNYYDNTGSDKSSAETKLNGLFDAASLNYVDTTADFTIDKVYLGRKYKDKVSGDSIFSNIKFGSSSAVGTLKFALKDMAVDSVIFRAAMYGDTEGSDGFSVNGTAFTLSAGNKYFENLKYVPAGDITALEIVQTKASKGRFYLTSITVYPKQGGVTPPAPEHTYTVAGGSDVLFGTTWAPANTANDMTLVEGLYTWEKTELTLAAGNIEFKVCEDHAWTNCWPSENYQLNIAEAGIYTVTITFNAETKEVAAVATKTGEAVVIPTVAMHGNFLGSWADTENFAVAQDNASASLTLTLAEGNYEFGMRIGGSGNWTANGANLTREANTTNLAEGSGNMHIAADVAGEYTFTYTYETQVLAVTYPAEAPVITTYEVAEAIAAGLAEDTEIQVRGIITKMEFKGKNFAKYGSVNIYVADATGAEGEFEFFNCYSLNADTFRTSTPAYDATSAAWEQFTEVVDANGNAIHVGDTVIAFGKYTLYNNTVYELKQGCYLVDVKAAPVQPAKEIVLEMNNGMVSNEYLEDYGTTDVILFNIPVTDAGYIAGDGDYLDISIYPEDPNDISGTYTVENEALDIEYTWLMQVAGTDTTYVEFVDGNVVIAIENAQVEEMAAELKVAANLTSVDGDTYIVTFDMVVYYDFIEEEQGIEDVAEDQKKAIKRIETGNVIIEKNGVRYNLNGQQIR